MNMHTLIPCHATAGGDDAKADMVRKAMCQAKLQDIIAEFTVSDLLKMHDNGYTSARRIQAAQRPDLERSNLGPAVVGMLLTAIEGM